MKVGDLVRYNSELYGSQQQLTDRIGIVVQILDRAKRDDNILVLWGEGRKWCVSEEWIENLPTLSSCDTLR